MLPVKFDPPISVNGKTMSSVNMRPSTIGDEEDAQVMAVDMDRGGVNLTMEMCLFSLVTGIPYDDIRALSTAAYKQLRYAYDEVNASRPIKRGAKKEKNKVGERPQDAPGDLGEATGQTSEND